MLAFKYLPASFKASFINLSSYIFRFLKYLKLTWSICKSSWADLVSCLFDISSYAPFVNMLSFPALTRMHNYSMLNSDILSIECFIILSIASQVIFLIASSTTVFFRSESWLAMRTRLFLFKEAANLIEASTYIRGNYLSIWSNLMPLVILIYIKCFKLISFCYVAIF